MSLKKRVRECVALLDQTDSGWRDRVDLTKVKKPLDIIEQVFGCPTAGCKRLRIKTDAEKRRLGLLEHAREPVHAQAERESLVAQFRLHIAA